MSILSSLPLTKRPREKLLALGAQALSLEELVAVILKTGIEGKDVLWLSSQVVYVLTQGNVSLAELANIPGVGPSKAAELLAALQLSAAVQQFNSAHKLSDANQIYAACQDLLDKPQEHLVVFFLTVRNQLLKREPITIGTATASLVHPREVFRSAIIENASSIVLAHNHPSGDPQPSQANHQVTRHIAQAGKQVGIQLIDHVICATKSFVSLQATAPELFE